MYKYEGNWNGWRSNEYTNSALFSTGRWTEDFDASEPQAIPNQ